MTRKKRNAITGSFVAHSLELRRSVAWRSLPDNARRVLDRLEVEHMEHGGAENGTLICTYDQFAEAGIRRNSVALAIRQCRELGFLEITLQGGRAISSFRQPTHYRLTYVFGQKRSGHATPTNEWQTITSDEEAKAALAKAANDKNYGTQPSERKRLRKQITGHKNGTVQDTKMVPVGGPPRTRKRRY